MKKSDDFSNSNLEDLLFSKKTLTLFDKIEDIVKKF